MKNFLITLVILLSTATIAWSHSEMNQTTPSDQSVLPEAPLELVLEFTKPIRLTSVNMKLDENQTSSLDLGEQTNFKTNFVIPFSKKGEGTYQIEWRGLGQDGHVMKGLFSFTVK